MAMPVQSREWTLDDLQRLPDDGNQYEVVYGELFVTPAPSYAHQSIVKVLHRLLDRYVEAEGLGHVEGPRSVIRSGGSEVEPDLMVRSDPDVMPEDWESAPIPILVVEVLSATTRQRDLIHKRRFYSEIGIPEYWIVDRGTRTIRVIRKDSEDAEVKGQFHWHPAGASAPCTVDVAEIFRS